jgi:hypothetical protein
MPMKMIALTPESTYRGQHGLLVAGQIYTLTEAQVAAIQSELALEGREFKYRTIKDTSKPNRPARKKKNQDGGKENEKSETGGDAQNTEQ